MNASARPFVPSFQRPAPAPHSSSSSSSAAAAAAAAAATSSTSTSIDDSKNKQRSQNRGRDGGGKKKKQQQQQQSHSNRDRNRGGPRRRIRPGRGGGGGGGGSHADDDTTGSKAEINSRTKHDRGDAAVAMATFSVRRADSATPSSTANQRRHRQKQQRRRHGRSDEKQADDNGGNDDPNTKKGVGSSRLSRAEKTAGYRAWSEKDAATHRKHENERRNRRGTDDDGDGTAGFGADESVPGGPRRATPDDALEADEFPKLWNDDVGFPTLVARSSGVRDDPHAATESDSGDNRVATATLWKEGLAHRLVASSSLESEQRRERQQRSRLQKAETERNGAHIGVLLTTLSSSAGSKRNAPAPENAAPSDVERTDDAAPTDERITDGDRKEGETTRKEAGETLPPAEASPLPLVVGNVPNTRAKWTGSELSRMRERWWGAVRAGRTQRRQSKQDVDAADEASDGSAEDGGDRCPTDEESSTSEGNASSSSSSSSGEEEESRVRHPPTYGDPTQPPSLSNTPFDETDAPREDERPAPTAAASALEVPRSVMELEELCLRSPRPLHCAVRNCAEAEGGSRNFCDDPRIPHDSREVSGESHEEMALRRLLTARDPADVLRWRSERVGLSETDGLEANDARRQGSKAGSLAHSCPASCPLLSADIRALTPLQLAIWHDLPRAVRLLLSFSAPSPADKDKRSEEEDERGRTAVMLACELGRVSCLREVLRASRSSKRLDRRERVGGNSAFHFCCTGAGRRLDKRDDDSEDDEDEDGATEEEECRTVGKEGAMDLLLQHAPAAQRRRAFLLADSEGRNLMHLACSRGDLRLVEFLTDRASDVPGLKISKALDAEDRRGRTPFLAAVEADADDVVAHLLTTRFAASPNYSLWFAGCPLIVAASKNSFRMTRLLLEIGYDASAARNFPGGGATAQSEANLALHETACRTLAEEDGRDSAGSKDDTYEIIRLLIGQGGANPHLPVTIRTSGETLIRGGEILPTSKCAKGKTTGREDSPLSAAARAADAGSVACMLDARQSASARFASSRRNDPSLRSQPESYFRLLEEREHDATHSSVDAALVASLFSLWWDVVRGAVAEGEGCHPSSSMGCGRCALVLYGRRSEPSFAGALRGLSQRALQWLENCIAMRRLVPPPLTKNNSMEGYFFEAPVVQYRIPNGTMGSGKKNDSYFMDWSRVLAELPWFHSRMNGVNCSWMRNALSGLSETEQIDHCSILAEDEFFLVVGGEKLLAHKSIVSAKSGKLAAHIRFSESRAREDPLADRISVHADLPLLIAKMLLCHCYHGSITFGLMNSPMKQCHQLLEMALVAEEYLCPSLLLECEIRLLMQTPSRHECICPYCSAGSFSTREQMDCPIRNQCLERAEKNLDVDAPPPYCEPAGVYAYKTSTFIMSSNRSGLVTPESAMDILAVAKQLEQSSPGGRGPYAMKYCRSGSIDDRNSTMTMPSFCGWDIDADNTIGAGCISVPFASVKMMAVWIMLRDFPAVIRSDSYLRQVKIDGEDEIAEVDASFTARARTGHDEDAILLLLTCLEELECSPFNKR